jgi:hypothetical protein
VADDIHPFSWFEPKQLNPGCHDLRIPREFVSGVRSVRVSVAWKVQDEHAPATRQLRGNLPPRKIRVVETVQKDNGRLSKRVVVRLSELDPVEQDAFDRLTTVPWDGSSWLTGAWERLAREADRRCHHAVAGARRSMIARPSNWRRTSP